MTSLFSPYQPFYFNCGAVALAAALMAVIRQLKINDAEVLLPAYACPELVSAVLFAGGTPVLVDLEPNSMRMDLDQLANKLNDKTVAVVAVSLFGIPERMREIRTVLKHRNAYLIEDNAQRFPVVGETFEDESEIVILSFGRGKPVSLLGGGAALAKDEDLIRQIKNITASLNRVEGGDFTFRLKAWLYNSLISPYLYWVPDSLPFLNLGQTRFKSMQSLSAANDQLLPLLPVNIQAYWQQGSEIQSSVMQMLAGVRQDSIVDLAVKECKASLPKLLRYPLLLATSALRDELYSALDREGLGVSKMYPVALPEIEGLENQFINHEPLPNAESFAGRILTLPIHPGVQRSDIDRMGDVIKLVCGHA